MKNKITMQESEIEQLEQQLSQNNENYSGLIEKVNALKKEIDTKNQRSNKEIESRIYTIPFIPQIDKVDLSRLMGKKNGLYEVELINIEALKFTSKDKNIDFQLTLSTKLLNENKVPLNGLISYYQYSTPDKGIINSTSSKLIVDDQSPHIFLEGNELYQISGKLVLKVSGKF
ncbi:MAG: hypothetical protein H8E72_02655 [Candidatus Marinimicrobia bacterium]|nr:hypothetical protein [Candidatus Neomarinimicrobiota bacterium]